MQRACFDWGLNECFCLTAHATFLEWNSDPEIADAAEKLYGDINFLELYVGLQAEEAKPFVDGAGLCPGKFPFFPLLYSFCS